MAARVVAAGRLDRRGELDATDCPGLGLGLHEELEDAVAAGDEEAEDPDLGLGDDRLLPASPVSVDIDPDDGEERSAPVSDLRFGRMCHPAGDIREVDDLRVRAALLGADGEPLVEPIGPVHGQRARVDRRHRGAMLSRAC